MNTWLVNIVPLKACHIKKLTFKVILTEHSFYEDKDLEMISVLIKYSYILGRKIYKEEVNNHLHIYISSSSLRTIY